MIFNIQDWRSKTAELGGLQKNNRFRVRFPIPNALFGTVYSGRTINDVIQYLEYWTADTNLPGVGLITNAVSRYGYGPIEKKPIAPMFNDIIMEFHNDSKNTHLQFFQDWIMTINNFDMRQGITTQRYGMDPFEISYKWEYAVDVSMDLCNVTGNTVHSVLLRECYPLLITEIKMSQDPQPQFMKITVLFNYFDWAVQPIST